MANLYRPSMLNKGVRGAKFQRRWTPLNDLSIPAWDQEAGPKALGGPGDQFPPKLKL